MNVTECRYSLAVEVGFLQLRGRLFPVEPATLVRFPAGTCIYFHSTTMAPHVGCQFVAGYES